MRKPIPAWRDALLAAGESSLYMPVWVLPVVLVAAWLTPHGDSWWVTRLHGFRTNPSGAFTLVGLLVVLRPVILFTGWLMLVTVGIVVVRRSWAEDLGSDLLKRIRLRRPVDDIRAALTERLQDGNADAPHVDAVLWMWVIARYERDAQLEAYCARRIAPYISRAPLKERAVVWCLRAWGQLGKTHAGLLPPICAGALERGRGPAGRPR